jgi:hypothetical protein
VTQGILYPPVSLNECPSYLGLVLPRFSILLVLSNCCGLGKRNTKNFKYLFFCFSSKFHQYCFKIAQTWSLYTLWSLFQLNTYLNREKIAYLELFLTIFSHNLSIFFEIKQKELYLTSIHYLRIWRCSGALPEASPSQHLLFSCLFSRSIDRKRQRIL